MKGRRRSLEVILIHKLYKKIFIETFTSSELRDGNEKQQYCCLVAQPSSTHHEVKLKKTGFFPQTVSAKKGDIVWWKWKGTNDEMSALEQVCEIHILCRTTLFSYEIRYVFMTSKQ